MRQFKWLKIFITLHRLYYKNTALNNMNHCKIPKIPFPVQTSDSPWLIEEPEKLFSNKWLNQIDTIWDSKIYKTLIKAK